MEHKDPDLPIPQNPYIAGLFAGADTGLVEALMALRVNPSFPAVELIAALSIALQFDDAAERWLAGEPIFAPAEIPLS